MHTVVLKMITMAGIIHQATGDISDKWYGQQAVYRLSMGNFVSNTALFRLALQDAMPWSVYILGHLQEHGTISCLYAALLWVDVCGASWSQVQKR